MYNHHAKTIEHTFWVDAFESETWHVEINWITQTDFNYGADADGNRGVEKAFIEDVKFIVRDPKGTDITKTVMEDWPEDYVRIEKQVQNYVEG